MKTKSLTGTPWELVKMFLVSETESVTPSPSCFSSAVWKKLEERQGDVALLLNAHVPL